MQIISSCYISSCVEKTEQLTHLKNLLVRPKQAEVKQFLMFYLHNQNVQSKLFQDFFLVCVFIVIWVNYLCNISKRIKILPEAVNEENVMICNLCYILDCAVMI